MKTINSDKVKEILMAVNEAYNILDDLHGDLTDQHEQIKKVFSILEEIPSPDDIEQLENEDKEDE